MEINKIILGDCIEVMKTLPDNSVDAIITDPPAGISFMGKSWDTFDKDMFGKKGQEGENDLKVKKNFKILPRYGNSDLMGFQDFICEVFIEAKRVLKPGGHCLVWAIPRTSHHTAMGLERAGFDVRDIISHVFGTGFPKSLNIGKQISKLNGEEREVVGINMEAQKKVRASVERGESNFAFGGEYAPNNGLKHPEQVGVISKGTSIYEGWGTALKPAVEHWILARKPLSEKTITENVLKHGTGGINIDGCRVEIPKDDKGGWRPNCYENDYQYDNEGVFLEKIANGKIAKQNPQGRFPANLIHDGSQEVLNEFPDVEDDEVSDEIPHIQMTLFNEKIEKNIINSSRFFYCAKASKSERNDGCDELEEKEEIYPGANSFNENGDRIRKNGSVIPPLKARNNHPTVKPISLMEYLIKLITPKDGIVLEPFAGSGTTCVACLRLGFKFIGIEKEEEYVKIANARINKYLEQQRLI